MEATGIALIKEQIASEQAALQAVAKKLQEDLAAVEAQLERLQAAHAILTGSLPEAASKGRAGGKRGHKPAANKLEVIRHIEAVLRDEAVAESVELKAKVEARLLAAGYSRMGLALRYREAMQDDRFVETPGGIRLRDAEGELALA